MSENRILNQMVMLMQYVEQLEGATNESKKEYVTSHLFDIMKVPEELQPLLAEVIDLLISVDRRKIRFRKNAKKFFIC